MDIYVGNLYILDRKKCFCLSYNSIYISIYQNVLWSSYKAYLICHCFWYTSIYIQMDMLPTYKFFTKRNVFACHTTLYIYITYISSDVRDMKQMYTYHVLLKYEDFGEPFFSLWVWLSVSAMCVVHCPSRMWMSMLGRHDFYMICNKSSDYESVKNNRRWQKVLSRYGGWMT